MWRVINKNEISANKQGEQQKAAKAKRLAKSEIKRAEEGGDISISVA